MRVSGVIPLRRQQDYVAPDGVFVKRDPCGFALPTETLAFGVWPENRDEVISMEPSLDEGGDDRVGRRRIVAPEQDVVTRGRCLNERSPSRWARDRSSPTVAPIDQARNPNGFRSCRVRLNFLAVAFTGRQSRLDPTSSSLRYKSSAVRERWWVAKATTPIRARLSPGNANGTDRGQPR